MQGIANEYYVNKLARDAKKRATFNKLIQMKKAVLGMKFQISNLEKAQRYENMSK